MARFLLAHRGCLLPLLMILAVASGCQSRHSIAADASKWLHAEGSGSQPASTESAPAVEAPVDRSVSADNRGRRGAADGSRRVTLAGYRDGAVDDRQAAAHQRRGTGNDSLASGGTSLSLSFVAMQDAKTADDKKTATASTHPQDVPVHKGHTLAEINNKLNNPGADLAQLQFKFNWNQYTGSLGGSQSLGKTLRSLTKGNPIRNLLKLGRASGGEGASSQNMLSLDFQPVFPFKLSNGAHFIIRPTIPMTWKPYYNERSNGFDNQFGLGQGQRA